MAQTEIAALEHNYSLWLTVLPMRPAACQVLKEKAEVGTESSKPCSEIPWFHPAILKQPRNPYSCSPPQSWAEIPCEE